MKMIGFSADDEKSVFKVVAGIIFLFSFPPLLLLFRFRLTFFPFRDFTATLHLGNIKFAGKGDSCDVSTMDGTDDLSLSLLSLMRRKTNNNNLILQP